MLEGFQVEAVKGDEYVRTLVVTNNTETFEINADAFFVELKLVPQSDIMTDLVERNELGHIIVDCANHTSQEGVFAAGDVTTIVAEQVLISIGEGAKAALATYEYLLTQPD